eukprot:UN03922
MQSNVASSNSLQYLDLGQNKNYKTGTITKRWENARSDWLNKNRSKKHANDPKDGLPTRNIPSDHKVKAKSGEMSLRRR